MTMSKPTHYFFQGNYMFAFNKVEFVRLFNDGGCNVIFGPGDDYISLSGDEANDFILAYHIFLTELEKEEKQNA